MVACPRHQREQKRTAERDRDRHDVVYDVHAFDFGAHGVTARQERLKRSSRCLERSTRGDGLVPDHLPVHQHSAFPVNVVRMASNTPDSRSSAVAERAIALPRGLYGHDQVDVAYEPWRAVRDSTLRVGPSADAPPVLDDTGAAVALLADQHLGRQSTRNPGCSDTPPLRPAAQGFVWGYGLSPATHKSGWMLLADLEPDPELDQLACGPASADFDRRRPGSCGGHCDGRPLTGVRAVAGVTRVIARDVYLRYAPGSTAFRYLLDGDEVRRLARWTHRGAAWIGVEARRARWAPRGARGWVPASALASAS